MNAKVADEIRAELRVGNNRTSGGWKIGSRLQEGFYDNCF